MEETFGCEYELFIQITVGVEELTLVGTVMITETSSYGKDFKGSLFRFQSGEPATVVPSAGDVIMYTADDRNIHYVDEMRPPMMLGGRLFGRSSLQSVGLQRQREGVAENAQPREQMEEFVPVELDSRVLHPSRKNGAKWLLEFQNKDVYLDLDHFKVEFMCHLMVLQFHHKLFSTVSPQAVEDEGTLTH
ncbi:unnamed protein product [Eruca vesicaria subsp. sativa]|uniref:Uncharacterized protein n=1 Tax=Eruca vesicaria subsp. sativa TaxID=29727 RepID=A0ABC8ITG3_ERUVS|nr:unnamed protein product [Eruca vesicaria subsp. sativa]